MASGAGNYSIKLTWLKGTRTRDDETGEDVLTHDEDGFLWGSVEETNGRRGEDYGAQITGADIEIRLRNYPAITVDDLLRDGWGNTYHIDSIHEGDNELVLTCYRNDTLEDFTEGGS